MFKLWHELYKKTTAIQEASELFKPDPHDAMLVYEFDFVGFFNNVRPYDIIQSIKTDSKELGNLIEGIMNNLYIEGAIQAEQETEILGVNFTKGEYPKVERQGLPQGLAMSPILATLSIEELGGEPEGLIMYADDGIILIPKKNQEEHVQKMEE